MVVRLAGLFVRPDVRPGHGAGCAGEDLRVCKIVVRGDLGVSEDDVAGGSSRAIHGDPINRAGGRREGDFALQGAAARIVVVSTARHRRQAIHCAARVGREERVKAARERIKSHAAGERRGPLIPDGCAARVGRVVWLPGFFRAADVRACHRAGIAWEGLGTAKLVVRRCADAAGHRPRQCVSAEGAVIRVASCQRIGGTGAGNLQIVSSRS